MKIILKKYTLKRDITRNDAGVILFQKPQTAIVKIDAEEKEPKINKEWSRVIGNTILLVRQRSNK